MGTARYRRVFGLQKIRSVTLDNGLETLVYLPTVSVNRIRVDAHRLLLAVCFERTLTTCSRRSIAATGRQ